MRRAGASLLAAAIALACLAPPAGAQTISNPDLFGKSASAAQQAAEHYGLWDDPEALRRVADIGYRLAGHSGYTAFPFSFFIVDMREPNAFALPGGQIFVTRGMLELGLEDDELAGLLGHEIAHVTLQHGVKMQRRATLLNVLSQAVLIGVIVASQDSGSRRDPDVPYGRGPQESSSADRVQGAAAASVILGELLLRSYSREYEDEADEEGQRIAAAAGFAPVGAADLFALMEARLPQSREYGYWRTHPFFSDRVGAARARGDVLKPLEPHPVDRFRLGTQATLLEFDVDAVPKLEPEERTELAIFLESAALTAWPQGESAERLRLAALDRLRAEEVEQIPQSRDYGRLLRAYEEQHAAVAAVTPESPFLARLDRDMADLAAEARELYPQAVEVLDAGVYQTRFLEIFLSNYPDAPQASRVALELARYYTRISKQPEAVEHYLQAWRAEPGGETGRSAIRGLRHLTPYLVSLAALEQLNGELGDPELEALAAARLEEIAGSFDELANGAEYLRRYPEGSRAEAVAARLDRLADKLYGEVILYQGVGDSIKALERIQQILTHAPLSPAAQKLRDRAVVEG